MKAEKSYKKNSRCWPGYVPVPGKSEHEEGSCRKASKSKNGGKKVDRETARKKQVAMGGERAKQAKAKSPNAAERRSVSKAVRKAAGNKSTSASHRSSRKSSTKPASSRKAPKRSTSAGKTGCRAAA